MALCGLVALSACETGSDQETREECQIGLTRAFTCGSAEPGSEPVGRDRRDCGRDHVGVLRDIGVDASTVKYRIKHHIEPFLMTVSRHYTAAAADV